MTKHQAMARSLLLLRLNSSLKSAAANDNQDFAALAGRGLNDNAPTGFDKLSGRELVEMMRFLANEAECVEVRTGLLPLKAKADAARLGVVLKEPTR